MAQAVDAGAPHTIHLSPRRFAFVPLWAISVYLIYARRLILNWFAAKKEFSSGIVEGLNYKIKLTIKKAYGFRTVETAETAIYHALGRLPEPIVTHEFC